MKESLHSWYVWSRVCFCVHECHSKYLAVAGGVMSTCPPMQLLKLQCFLRVYERTRTPTVMAAQRSGTVLEEAEQHCQNKDCLARLSSTQEQTHACFYTSESVGLANSSKQATRATRKLTQNKLSLVALLVQRKNKRL